MKTVLLVNSSGARYFRRENGIWHSIENPGHDDRLWVIANLPEETLEEFKIPLLFWSDRSNFIERRLAAAYPHSQYRAAPIISGNLLKPGTAVATGLTTAEAVTSQLAKLDTSIAGVWGVSMLLTLLARRLRITYAILAIPSVHYLRIVVLKGGVPVLTRCIHRYGEERETDSDSNEILRTRQHLENRRIFEHEGIPPVLYLGDTAMVAPHLAEAGMELLPLPEALTPKGEAAYLHPLFDFVITSPAGQLAPLQLRARHLAQRVHQAAYAGIAASILGAVLFGQQDFRALISLYGQEQRLNTELQRATNERERLAGQISASGLDPVLVRQATKFSELEMEAASTPESLLQFTASTIAELPQVRIKDLTYRFPQPGEPYCQGHNVIDVPLINKKIDLSFPVGGEPADASSHRRYTELQFSILLTENLTPAAQLEIRKRISAILKAKEGVQLMLDPAAFSLINTLKGGFGMESGQTENLWCMSIPWNPAQTGELP